MRCLLSTGFNLSSALDTASQALAQRHVPSYSVTDRLFEVTNYHIQIRIKPSFSYAHACFETGMQGNILKEHVGNNGLASATMIG